MGRNREEVDLLFSYDLRAAMLHGKLPERLFHKRRLKTLLNAYDYSGKKILDFGCNTGTILIPFIEKGYDVVGLDISKNDIYKAKEYLAEDNLQADLVLGDGKNSPIKDNSFDLILAIDLLEHVGDPEKVVAEIWRMLKGGGTVLVTVPWKYHPVVRFSLIRKLLSSRKTIDEAPDIPYTASMLDRLFEKFKVEKRSLKFYYVVIFATYKKPVEV